MWGHKKEIAVLAEFGAKNSGATAFGCCQLSENQEAKHSGKQRKLRFLAVGF